MKNTEIFIKDVVNHRITITPTRVTVKVKLNTTKEELDEVERIASIVADQLKDVTQSFRGIIQIDKNIKEVWLQNDKRDKKICVKYEN